MNEMVTANVPAEIMPAVTGHEAEELSQLIHYFRPTVSMMIPGLLPLYGWKPVARGAFAMSAHPACLSRISSQGVDDDKLADVVDFMLNLRPHFTDPSLLRLGRLRPFANHMAASLIMHYPELDRAGEVHVVTSHMRNCLHRLGFSNNPSGADLVLRSWSDATKAGFDADNLDLTCDAHRLQSPHVDAIVNTVQQLHSVLFSLSFAIFAILAILLFLDIFAIFGHFFAIFAIFRLLGDRWCKLTATPSTHSCYSCYFCCSCYCCYFWPFLLFLLFLDLWVIGGASSRPHHQRILLQNIELARCAWR